MCVFKEFTAADIFATAEISRSNGYKYLRALCRAGYIRTRRKKANGKSMGHIVWFLVRNTGPRRPLPRWDGTGVWDQNQQKLYPYAEQENERLARRAP